MMKLKKKIISYYQNKYKNLELSEEEIEKDERNKFTKSNGAPKRFLDKYNINRDISVRLPDITDQIIEKITPSKIVNMLIQYYGSYKVE